MSYRNWFVLTVIAIAVGFAGVAGATTCVCPSSENLTIGTHTGDYTALCAEDSNWEVLTEGLDNGVSKLRVTYTFTNVPAGTLSLTFKGKRPANSDGDNFQFAYNLTGQAHGIVIPGAVIDKNFWPAGGLNVPLNVTTTSTSTVTLFLYDTSNSGSGLDSCTLDLLEICSQ